MGFLLKKVHPAVFVTAGFFLLILLQRCEGHALATLVLTLVVAGVVAFGGVFARVIKRMRYIFLSLLVLFLWQTPGVLMVPSLGVFSPTWDGVRAAQEPGLRLFGVISVVSFMLHAMSMDVWINSLFVLLKPLQCLGFPAERFAVRLRLVLSFVENTDLNWRQSLGLAFQAIELEGREVWLVSKLGSIDRVLIGFFVALTFGCLLL